MTDHRSPCISGKTTKTKKLSKSECYKALYSSVFSFSGISKLGTLNITKIAFYQASPITVKHSLEKGIL